MDDRTEEGDHIKARIDQIEFEIACGQMNAMQTFTQMRQLMHLNSSAAKDAARYRQVRLGLSDVHGDVYAMVFAEDGDYPVQDEHLDRLADEGIARKKPTGGS